MLPFDSAERAVRFDCAASGAVGSRMLLGGPGTLIGLQGFNVSGGTRYVQVFDAPAVPANGAAPVAVVEVPAGENFCLEMPIVGLPFHNGIAMAVSTTVATLTLSGTADVLVWGSLVGDVA